MKNREMDLFLDWLECYYYEQYGVGGINCPKAVKRAIDDFMFQRLEETNGI